MNFFYDLHIHSDLSPCGNNEMTPNNIVNMAFIKGLNIISVTDHNSVENFPAINKIAEQRNIKVLPGMEVTTKEEVHLLSYFTNYNNAKEFSKIIYESLPNITNKPNIFGEQNIYNENDEIIEKVDKLLLSPSIYNIIEICDIVSKFNGIVVPAHVDKQAYGIIGVLGFIPNNLKFNYIEVFNEKKLPNNTLNDYFIIKNSDAHRLADISEAINYFECQNIGDFYNKFFKGMIK